MGNWLEDVAAEILVLGEIAEVLVDVLRIDGHGAPPCSAAS